MGFFMNQGTNSATSEDWVNAIREQGITIRDGLATTNITSTSDANVCTHGSIGPEFVTSHTL
jgi:hypothetical protein